MTEMSLRSILHNVPPPTPPCKYKKRSPRSMQGELAAQHFLEEGSWAPGTAVRTAICSECGSDAVRGALEGASPELQQRILQDFVGRVGPMLRKQHACDVLRYCVARYDEGTIGFVMAEMLKTGFDIVAKKHLELLSEAVRKGWTGDATQRLLSTAVDQIKDHWRGRYTTHLYQEIMQSGESDHRNAIIDSLVSASQENWSEFSSGLRTPTGPGDLACIFLVSDIVANGGSRADPLVTALIRDTDLITGLASRRYGAVLIKALLSAAGKEADYVQERFCSAFRSLSESDLLRLQEALMAPRPVYAGHVYCDSLEANAQAEALVWKLEQARTVERLDVCEGTLGA